GNCGDGQKKPALSVREGRRLTEGSLVSSRACAPCTHAPVRLSNRRNAHGHATNEIERESVHRLAEVQRTKNSYRWMAGVSSQTENYTAQLRTTLLPATRFSPPAGR